MQLTKFVERVIKTLEKNNKIIFFVSQYWAKILQTLKAWCCILQLTCFYNFSILFVSLKSSIHIWFANRIYTYEVKFNTTKMPKENKMGPRWANFASRFRYNTIICLICPGLLSCFTFLKTDIHHFTSRMIWMML